MESKPYDFKGFVQAYMDAHRPNYVHEDFRTFYAERLNKLETAFNINISKNHSPLHMLFDWTVRSYWNTSSPGEGALEGSLITRHLEANEAGHKVLRTMEYLNNNAKQSREAHLQMLYDLFVCIFGEVSTVVSSDTLMELGFDDFAEPKLRDYFDYM